MNRMFNNLVFSNPEIIKKSIHITMFAIITIYLFYINHRIGIYYCEKLNISNTLTLTSISFGIALEIAVILTVLEVGIINYIFNKLSNL